VSTARGPGTIQNFVRGNVRKGGNGIRGGWLGKSKNRHVCPEAEEGRLGCVLQRRETGEKKINYTRTVGKVNSWTAKQDKKKQPRMHEYK